MAKLNSKQAMFCQEYLLDLNATQAAIRAGYSEKTAGSQAFDLLKKPEIQTKISKLKNSRSDRTEINADYVLQRHREIDELDILEIVKSDLSGFRSLEEWPRAWRISISAIDISELFDYQDGSKELVGLIKKIKWPDKVKNLELLGKHVDVQAYNEKIEHTVEVNNVMVVPGCTSVDDWEKHSQEQQSELLSE
tara:strand:- start:1676 stop:2254 length:579 start_codon:yes stop_codon:yes gene_type:complete